MGNRKLKQLINYPLLNEKEINYRLDAVEDLYKNLIQRDKLTRCLSCIDDLERILVNLYYGKAQPKDCLAINRSLYAISEIKNVLKDMKKHKALTDIERDLDPLEDIQNEISKCLVDDKFTLGNGDCIKAGYDVDFDQLKNLAFNNENYKRELEEREIARTNAKTLKIKYNKILGYFIELTKLQATNIPEDYRLKQTLSNTYRYTTPELIDLESKILYANENIGKQERRIFANLTNKIAEKINLLQKTTSAIMMLDIFNSFAIVSTMRNYTRPTINSKSKQIIIENGRHPVIEILTEQPFVPNNTNLNNSDTRTMIITGPNMAGKSTYMRQVALITILAHIGCFVPCSKCEIGLVDKIFTRIGASDDLTQNQSTFMVEMSEVSYILENCTDDSLILLDEVGRGTSTLDGMSIAMSILEYLSTHKKSKTLFSTHYHEITDLEGKLDGVKNFKVEINEFNGKLIFLRKISRGGANKSFGIEVGAMAGLPKEVITNSKLILKNLEQQYKSTPFEAKKEIKTKNYGEVLNRLRELDVNNLTPLDSFLILVDLYNKTKNIDEKE